MANEQAKQLQESWELDARWNGVARPYSAEDVIKTYVDQSKSNTL